jgi:hypothetical protein
MRAVLALIVVVALLNAVDAQYCDGYNVTTNIGFNTTRQCPYGYVADRAQGKCWTVRQVINNFLLAPCHQNSDCYPVGASLSTLAQVNLVCGTDNLCGWSKTRAIGDSCTSNSNCYQYTGLSTTVGCDKSTKKCAITTPVYTANLNDKCNYVDGATSVACVQPMLTCSNFIPSSGSVNGTCTSLLDFGATCKTATNLCRTDGFCINVNSTYATCQASKKSISQSCVQDADCAQTPTLAYCNSNSKTCAAYQPLYATCNTTTSCTSGTYCTSINGTFTCVLPPYSNETCWAGTPSCATGLSCITGLSYGSRCFFGNLTDPCNTDAQCKTGSVCMNLYNGPNSVCVSQVGVGQNCSAGSNMCLSPLMCMGAPTSAMTCVAPVALGQACDPVSNINPLAPKICAQYLLCSRGLCIQNFTKSVGTFCSQNRDCDTSYCDTVSGRCTQRRLCMSDSDCSVGSSADAVTGQCACNGGGDNMGQCILTNCGKQKAALLTCLNTLNPYQNYSFGFDTLPTAFVPFLDTQSSFYTKCLQVHADYVTCQAIMNKWGAPSVGLGDLINYNLNVSPAATVAVSFMSVVVFIMSTVMLL